MNLQQLLLSRNFPPALLPEIKRRVLDKQVPDAAARVVYLAQPIHNNALKRRWVPPFKRWAAERNVYCFDPVVDFKQAADNPEVLVRFDYTLIRHSHLVVCDFTRGPSIGVTAEMIYAHNIGTAVLGVVNKTQSLSAFGHHYCNFVITPDQLPEYATRVLGLAA